MLNEITPADGQQLETKALSLSERASALTIHDQPSYDAAVEFLQGVKALRREAEDHHRPGIDAAHKAHKIAVATLGRIDIPLGQAERAVKDTMAAWVAGQERIRRAEEDRLRLEAAKAQEAELERQIEQAEAEGATNNELDVLIEQSAMIAPPPPTVAPTYSAAPGISVRKSYVREITNLQDVIRWVAANPQFLGVLKVDGPALNRLPAQLTIPGTRVVEKSTVAVR